MNKKAKIILISIGIIIIILLLLGIYVYILEINSNNLKYEIIKDGYCDYKSKIISTYQEYLELVDYFTTKNSHYGTIYNFDSNKYNKYFFEKNSLAIINIVTGSSMNELRNLDLSIQNNILVCDVDIGYANTQFVTADITGKLLLVEIDKSVTNLKIQK